MGFPNQRVIDMVLTDNQIRALCAEGVENALITPFNEDALQSESYDLSIDNEVSLLKKDVRCIELEEKERIENLYITTKIPDSGFELRPKEYCMVAIKETITLPNYLTAHIRPRTRLTRLGLIACDQHCNSTYSGNLRLGLLNATDNVIKIKPNLKIAQIVFEELKGEPSENKLYKNKKDAAYQNESEFIGSKISDEVRQYVDEAVNILLGK